MTVRIKNTRTIGVWTIMDKFLSRIDANILELIE